MLPGLKDYQIRVIEYGIKHPYSILAAGAGLGKTRSAIEIREKFKAKCLIVCPAYLILNWIDEIKLWAPKGSKILAIRKGKDICDPAGYDYVLISYDLAKKAEHFFSWADMVILEEAHNIKSMKAQRTQFIHRAIYENSIKRVHLLTGTPIKNRTEEFYSLLALTFYNPNTPDAPFLTRFPSSIDFADHFSFRHEYDLEVGNRFVKIIKWTGIRNIPELKQYLKGRYIRIKTEDALDLPPVSFKDVMISELPDESLINAFNSQFGGEDTDGVDPRAKAQAALKKVPVTIQYAQNLLEEIDCLVIYSDHVEASEAIAKAFNTVALNGGVTAQKRMEFAKRFQAGEGKVLVATIGGLSEGVTLTRASHMIINDYPWVPGNLEQVIRRVARLSQTKKCFIHRIIGSPQDEKIMDTIESKLETINKVT